MAEALVTLDVTRAGVAYLRLNNPDQMNVLSPEMITELYDRIEDIRATPTIRVVLLEGVGRAFSAGIDLKTLDYSQDYSHTDHVEDSRALFDVVQKLHNLETTTVALVNGAALGGAIGLIAACDMAVGVKWAEFRLPEVRLGLSPAPIVPFVVKAIGPRWARALFVTGKAFDADLARDIGLLHYVVEDLDSLHAEAEEIVKLVFHTAPGAVAEAKQLVEDVMWREIDSGLRKKMAQHAARSRENDEGKEGVAAFLEKRKPKWAE